MPRRRPQPPPSRRGGRRRPVWLLPLVVAVVLGFLYYRPVTTYLDTRSELRTRRAEVVALRREKQRFEAQLARASSLEVLARDARGIGYVAPGEQLFIVKGIEQWRREHATEAAAESR